jgi:uncharacterized membrane protein YgdD (TMEM256/DUF423 family)
MKNLLIIAAVSGFLSVALGAFGAHALRDKLTEAHMHIYEKAVLYQFVHTLAIFGVAILLAFSAGNAHLVRAGWFFFAGILLFSGSLYFYTMTGQKFWAMITPVGGVSFMIGWVFLFLAAWKITGGSASVS